VIDGDRRTTLPTELIVYPFEETNLEALKPVGRVGRGEEASPF